jgi:hypothetical protein
MDCLRRKEMIDLRELIIRLIQENFALRDELEKLKTASKASATQTTVYPGNVKVRVDSVGGGAGGGAVAAPNSDSYRLAVGSAGGDTWFNNTGGNPTGGMVHTTAAKGEKS